MLPVEIHDRGRGPELKGTRVTVYDIVPYRIGGCTPAEIADALALDEIGLPHIETLFHYMDEHYEEVMREHNEIEARFARGNSPEIEPRLRESSLRFQARLAEIRQRGVGRNGEGHSR